MQHNEQGLLTSPHPGLVVGVGAGAGIGGLRAPGPASGVKGALQGAGTHGAWCRRPPVEGLEGAVHGAAPRLRTAHGQQPHRSFPLDLLQVGEVRKQEKLHRNAGIKE